MVTRFPPTSDADSVQTGEVPLEPGVLFDRAPPLFGSEVAGDVKGIGDRMIKVSTSTPRCLRPSVSRRW
jgi:hypothetical protein